MFERFKKKFNNERKSDKQEDLASYNEDAASTDAYIDNDNYNGTFYDYQHDEMPEDKPMQTADYDDKYKKTNYTQQVNDCNKNNMEGNYIMNMDIFSAVEEEYKRFKESLIEEMTDYEDTIKRERNQANKYRNKVQVRDVMDVLLPILSDLLNDINESNDLSEIKMLGMQRYMQMMLSLKGVGVELKRHNIGSEVANDEQVNCSIKITPGKEKDGKVARSNKIGCVIRNEEDNPIREDVELYIYKQPEEERYQQPNVEECEDMRVEPEQSYDERKPQDILDEAVEMDKRIRKISVDEERKNNDLVKIPVKRYLQRDNCIMFDKPICIALAENTKMSIMLIRNDVPIELDKKICSTPNKQNSATHNVVLYHDGKTISEPFTSNFADDLYSYNIERMEHSANEYLLTMELINVNNEKKLIMKAILEINN